MLVSAIESGTVIDHIPASSLFKVIKILGLDRIRNQITFGTNLESKTSGKKAIIKIAGKFFEDDDIDRIALVAPKAKLNIIRDYQVIEKRVVEVPDTINAIAKCMNPKCITNFEKAMKEKVKKISDYRAEARKWFQRWIRLRDVGYTAILPCMHYKTR